MPKYQIIGSDLQVVLCDLAPGEKVIAETGHLLALSDGLELNTNVTGGLVSGIKRMFGGSSFFINEITAHSAGRAMMAASSIGKIQELDITAASGWLCQPHVFLCSDPEIEIGAALTQKFGAGLFGGAGFVLQSLQGMGKAFIHVGGACLKVQLEQNQTLRVETGALAAFESSVTYDIQLLRSIKSILFSGEGLWFAHLRGPGTVFIQSTSLPRLAGSLLPYLPTHHSSLGSLGTVGAVGGLLGAMLSGNDD